MTGRRIHYEDAFEDFLRTQGIPYVAVDDDKQTIFGKASIKSFDFVVYSHEGPNLIVDIKGRKFPDVATAGAKRSTRAWENWITRQDLDGLTRWQDIFGSDFQVVLVFAYWLQGKVNTSPFDDVYFYNNSYYAFMAMPLSAYVSFAQPRSEKWQTIAVPSRIFADNAVDIRRMLNVL
ncbi:MAG TPA: HYExAFE family protein [Phycisphaerae bacterium]|nr:HYExAFE family protein [Phycisphaerae bacterium]